MVYEYTLGDGFKNNSELKSLKQQAIKDWQNYGLSEDKKNRMLAIKNTYPGMPTGLISSLVQTDATNDQVKQAATEQEVINAQVNKNYTKTPASISDTIKNVFVDHIGGGFKRTVKFAFDTWNHTQEQLVMRGLRSRVMFSDEVEQQLIQKGLPQEEAQKIAGVYAFNPLFPVGSPESRAIANGVARLMGRKDFGISDNFVGETGARKLAGYYEQAGPSSLEYTLRKISEKAELNPDDYIKNIPQAYRRLGISGVTDAYDELTGTGFLPGGESEKISSELKEANLYKNRNITFGRYITNQLGVESPTIDKLISGTIDAGILIFTDPAAAIGKSGKALKGARSLQRKINEAVKEGNLDDVKTLANTFIDSEMGKTVAENIVKDKSPDKFIRLLDANDDPAYALKLFEANTADEIVDITRDALLNGTSWNVPKINRTKILPDWINDSAYKAFGAKRAAAKADDPLSYIGRYIPENEVNLQDWKTTVNSMVNHGTVGQLPRKEINDIAVRLTKSLVDEDYKKAQDILADDYYGKLIDKVSDNPKVVESYKVHRKKARGFRDENVVYSIDNAARKSGEGLKPITTRMQKTTKVGGESIDLQTPFPDQIMDRTFYFTDHRELKRTVGQIEGVLKKPFNKNTKGFNPDTPMGKFMNNADVTFGELTGKVPDYMWNSLDVLWKGQRTWSTANLPLRLAYPLRLVLEGQPRMAVYGLDSIVNAPKSYLDYALLIDEDVLGKKFVENAWSKKDRALQQGLDKAVANSAGKHFGPKAMKGFVNENFSEFTLSDNDILENTEKVKRFSEAIRIQLAGIWRNDIAENIASYTVEGKSFDELSERLWSGDLKNLRIDYEKALDRAERLTSVEDVKSFLNGYKQRIVELTGGDIELLDSIATGTYKGIDVKSWDRRKTENVKVIMDGIEDMLRTSDNRPGFVPAPDELINSTYAEYVDEYTKLGNTGISDTLWFMAGAMEANINRIPAYKQLYFRSVADDLVQATPEAAKKLMSRIKKLPKSVKKELEELYPYLTDDAKKINDNQLPKMTLEQIDQRAQIYALEEHNRILYNLSQKGLVADSLRLVFPFLEAFKEVTLSWAKGIAQQPKYAHRAEMALTNARSSGITFQDPLSDEQMIAFPMPEFIANRLLGGNESGNLSADVVTPISGFNLISVSLLPGVGPVVAVGAGMMKNTLIDTFGEDAFKLVFPFGTPIEEVADLGNPTWFADVLLPNYIKSAIAAINVSPESPTSWISQDKVASRVLDSAKVVGLSKVRPMQSAEDLAAFDDAVIQNVKFRLFVEAGLQFFAPSPPRILMSTEIKKDNAMQLLEAVIGEADLGKISVNERKTMVSMGVLTSFYSQLRQEYQEEYGIEDGEELAWIVFNRMIGTDESGKFNSFGNALLKKGKYQQTEGKLPRFENEVQFKRNNKEFMDKYPLTGIYLTPDIDEEGELNDDAFFKSLESDAIEQIDPLIFAIESQQFLYNLVVDAELKKLRGDNSKEAIKLKRKIKNDAAEMFPMGVPGILGDENFEVVADREIRFKKPSDYNAKINELREMSMDPAVQEVSPQWLAINNYFAARENAIVKIAETQGYEYPQDLKLIERKLSTGTTDIDQDMREILRSIASNIGSEYPEFLVLYDELLKYEIQFNKED